MGCTERWAMLHIRHLFLFGTDVVLTYTQSWIGIILAWGKGVSWHGRGKARQGMTRQSEHKTQATKEIYTQATKQICTQFDEVQEKKCSIFDIQYSKEKKSPSLSLS